MSRTLLQKWCKILVLIMVTTLVVPFGKNATAMESYEPTLQFGTVGTEPGQFSTPYGVAVDSFGYIYVVDGNNHRIQKFSADGIFITQWGSYGSESGQFSAPFGIAVDHSGFVYVTDSGNLRVQKFTASGEFITSWATSEPGPVSERRPLGIAVDSYGNVYVAAWGTLRKYSPTGDLIAMSEGFPYLKTPMGVAVDSSGYVYAADTNNYSIKKFTPDLIFITSWATTDPNYSTTTYFARGIAVDSTGNVFVTDYSYHRIIKYSYNGTFVTMWDGTDTTSGQLSRPNGIALDASNHVFVTDSGNNQIVKFSSYNPGVGVSITATVYEPPVLTFSVAGGFPPAGGAVSDTAVNFGALEANTPKTATQRLLVSTNTTAGYTVTVEENHPLVSGNNYIFDALGDAGAITETVSGSWENNAKYGFGYTLLNLTESDAVFTSGYRQFADRSANELPVPIMVRTSPTLGSEVEITYKLNIGPAQPAGTYSNTITYIAIGNF